MSRPHITPEELYATIAKALVKNPDVTQSQKKGFGSSALWINGRIFALLSSKHEFVVKLPKQRVDALVASGEGKRFDPRHDGRLMKEWMALGETSEERWLPLAKEAMKFTASKR